MDLQEIDVMIDRDGRVRLEVRGVQGTSCLELTKALEVALGGVIEERTMTPEALTVIDVQQQQQQRNTV